MKTTQHVRLLVAILTVATLFLAGCGGGANSVDRLRAGVRHIEPEEDQLKVSEAIAGFADAPALTSYFENSFGCAIFPTIGKGGMGVGGAYGKGWVFRRGRLAGDSGMTQVTVGFQFGGQAFSQIIFFEDERAFNDFTSGNFEFGAQASAVAITAGANASASTAGGASAGAGKGQAKGDYTGGMAVFTHAKGGLMYEATLGGQKFSYKDL
jgi:lipid-binding SYLF domain-containing protein